ncbi:heavy-metal-associated domain-containing protein [Haloplanus halophilus]|uniref:heavy-metal-associated domain-containing protein n=1 Tax=Haloplanus halophilus TaxID=2949993 RepID=UPI00203CAEFD|nr:cation transporter [Haloplanus sp. GDY1]
MSRTITVDGMACASCERTVEGALEAVDGVTVATADADAASATVDGNVGRGALVAAVEDAGYEASPPSFSAH